MIWVLGIALALVISLYLAAPFLAQNKAVSTSEEIEAYKSELRAIERSEEPEKAKRAIIQARLIKAAKTDLPFAGARSFAFPLAIGIILVGASAGIYAFIGSPNFAPETRQIPPAASEAEGSEYADLLPRFEARLAENPNDATAWTLYGRTLMLVGDLSAGLRAYEKALELTDTPDIRKEYDAARKFAAQVRTGPSAEDIAAMQNLSPEDRTAAIEGMVESLSARLADDPDDTEGWVRLLRSRKVLGQTEAGEEDIKTLRQALPDQAEAIIERSGWRD